MFSHHYNDTNAPHPPDLSAGMGSALGSWSSSLLSLRLQPKAVAYLQSYHAPTGSKYGVPRMAGWLLAVPAHLGSPSVLVCSLFHMNPQIPAFSELFQPNQTCKNGAVTFNGTDILCATCSTPRARPCTAPSSTAPHRRWDEAVRAVPEPFPEPQRLLCSPQAKGKGRGWRK